MPCASAMVLTRTGCGAPWLAANSSTARQAYSALAETFMFFLVYGFCLYGGHGQKQKPGFLAKAGLLQAVLGQTVRRNRRIFWRSQIPLPSWCSMTCRPHSFLSVPAQRPARSSSPSLTGCVHGQQPMLG